MYGIVQNVVLSLLKSVFGIVRSGANLVLSAGSGGVITTGTWFQSTSGRARLTSNYTNATATMSNLTDLTLTLLAGRKYIGKMVLHATNSTAAEGIKFDFAGGTVAITSFWAAGAAVVGGTTVVGAATSASLAGDIDFTTITGATIIEVNISMVVDTGGTFIPRASESTTAVGTLTIALGSFLLLEDSPN